MQTTVMLENGKYDGTRVFLFACFSQAAAMFCHVQYDFMVR